MSKTVTKGKRPTSLDEIAYKLTEIWADYEDGSIEDSKVDRFVKIASTITNIAKTKLAEKAVSGDRSRTSFDINDFTQKQLE